MTPKKKDTSTARFSGTNAQFNALSKIKKRLVIAKDILYMIRYNKFVPGFGYGNVIDVPEDADMDSGYNFPLGDMQTHIKNGMVCEGCAKAAIIVSRAKLGNNVKVDKGTYNSDLAFEVSYEIFGETCADVIEALYEDDTHHVEGWTNDRHKAYAQFRDALPTKRRDRMKAIYQNIVKNEGRLVIGKYKY